MTSNELPQDRVSAVQAALLVATGFLGVGFLAMPRLIVEVVGRDGWLLLALGGLAASAVTVLLVKLAWRFPGMAAPQYHEAIVGRYIGKLLSLWLAAFFILVAAASVRTFSDVIKLYLLPNTPPEIILFTMLLAALYLVSGGINPLGRMAEVFFPVTTGLFLLVILAAQTQVDYRNLLPVLAEGPIELLKKFPTGYGVYAGYGAMLFLVPLMQSPKKALRAGLFGTGVTTFFYLLAFTVVIAAFGPTQASYFLLPVQSLARQIMVPAAFIERLDLLMLTTWTLSSFLGMVIPYYWTILTLNLLFRLSEQRLFAYLLFPLLYVLALAPADVNETFSLHKFLGLNSLVLALGLYPALYLIAAARFGRSQAKT